MVMATRRWLKIEFMERGLSGAGLGSEIRRQLVLFSLGSGDCARPRVRNLVWSIQIMSRLCVTLEWIVQASC